MRTWFPRSQHHLLFPPISQSMSRPDSLGTTSEPSCFPEKLKNEVTDELTDKETDLLTHPAIHTSHCQRCRERQNLQFQFAQPLFHLCHLKSQWVCVWVCVCVCAVCLFVHWPACVIDKSEQPEQTVKDPCEH